MNINQLNRRASAEGISLQAIKGILSRIHEETDHGVSRHVASDDDIKRHWGSPEYRGGYMYAGSVVMDNTILPGADILETRWSKSPSDEPSTPQSEWDAAVEAAPVGAVFEIHDLREETIEERFVKTGPNEWECVTYDSRFERWGLDNGVTLYEGIRQEIADELGVETSSTFHACFDAAVDALSPY